MHCTSYTVQSKVKIMSQQAILNWLNMFTIITQDIPQNYFLYASEQKLEKIFYIHWSKDMAGCTK